MDVPRALDPPYTHMGSRGLSEQPSGGASVAGAAQGRDDLNVRSTRSDSERNGAWSRRVARFWVFDHEWVDASTTHGA